MATNRTIGALGLKFFTVGTKRTRADIKNVAGAVQTSTARMNASLARSERRVRRFRRSMSGMGREFLSLRHAMAGIVGVLGARGLINSLDAIGVMRNRLKSFTPTVAASEAAMAVLADTSKRTFSDMATNAEAFQKIAFATKGMGLNMKEVTNVLENMNKGMAVSGVQGIQAQQAMLQFSQALAKGVLNGDEFRTIQESFPFLLDIIAAKIGKTRAEIVQMGRDQQITRDILVSALREPLDMLEERFDKVVPTIRMSLANLNTSWMMWLNSMDNATGITGMISKSILWMSENFTVLANILAVGLAGTAVVLAVKGIIWLGTTIVGLATTFITLSATLLASPLFWAAAAIGGGMIAAIVLIEDEVTDLSSFFGYLGNVIIDWASTGVAAVKTVADAFSHLPKAIANGAVGLINKVIRDKLEVFNSINRMINAVVPGANLRMFDPEDFTMDAPFGGVADFTEERFKQHKIDSRDSMKITALKLKQSFSGGGLALDIDGFLKSMNGVNTVVNTLGESSDEAAKALEKLKKEMASFAEGVKKDLMTDADKVEAFAKKVNKARAMGFLTEEEARAAISKKTLDIDPTARGFADQERSIQGMMDRIQEIRGAISAIEKSAFLTDDQKKTMIGKLVEESREAQGLAPIIDEAGFAFQGLEATINGTKGALTEFLNTGKLDFTSFVNSLLEDLNRLAVDAAFNELFGANPAKTMMGGMSASGGGIFGDLFGIASSMFSGGSSTASLGMSSESAFGSEGMVDGFSLGFANGGFVAGPGGPRSDSIPAMLSDGEFVVNAASTKKFLPLLKRINAEKAVSRATGGPVSGIQHFADGGYVSNGQGGMTNNFHISAMDAQSFMDRKTQRQMELEVAASMRRTSSRLG